MFVEHLPPEALTRRAAGDETAGWGLGEQLLASIADTLRAANWQRAGKGVKPKPIPRPGVEQRKPIKHGAPDRPEQVAAYLSQFLPPPTEDVVLDGN